MASLKAGLTCRDLDGELVVLDAATGYIHQMNPTAALIWKLLDGGTSIESIEARLSEEFDLDDAEARRDVLGFVEQLQRAGLLEAIARDSL
ncbi:HPr-rel-A system PqqD family peptide chaperone [Thiocapsa marina]|uniref:Coenzyme pqq synthesis protein d (PqqD) n=1 Tax=Thiocapsa marina 5811 TaxID=768671 RepID=F9UAV0_9GAMM|nr:HPr-rel-A system PqqD family peptide chaperone [Thiocapsa marina]EGV18568.1 coenzyme pqq synthesis protein d (PqqD) [Thiocapsa marina 5811]